MQLVQFVEVQVAGAGLIGGSANADDETETAMITAPNALHSVDMKSIDDLRKVKPSFPSGLATNIGVVIPLAFHRMR